MYMIYHVKGIKVGCTKNFEARCLQNKAMYGDDIEIEILEILEDEIGDSVAGDVELGWSISLGYRKQTHYKISCENLDGAWSWKGKKGFAVRTDLARTSYLTKEQYQELGRKGGRKGFEAQWKAGKNPFHNSEIQSRNAKRAAELGRGGMKKIVECPHCGKSGMAAIMGRWHFDKCRNKNISLDADSKIVVTSNLGQSP